VRFYRNFSSQTPIFVQYIIYNQYKKQQYEYLKIKKSILLFVSPENIDFIVYNQYKKQTEY